MHALTPGSRLGPYDIQVLIGQGGMGEVYRATDTRLKRAVALKVLPQSLSSDPERLARFEREAQTLAALNHPHIAAIFGIEESNGTRALVMELVEGPTLADRIARGPIPLDEALPIARQIAEALEAAHEAGIVHRDLKPANIKLRPDGTVKVLDFGLAKAMEPVTSGHASRSPTVTSPAIMTHAGMILGTAAYMSPEQARGNPVDKRTDVWAFGCVLYEMLTGLPPFAGATVSDTIAAILRTEPAWDALPVSTSDHVRHLLQRCLQKDRGQRLRDIGDARLGLEDVGEVAAPQSAGFSIGSRRSLYLAWGIAGVATIAAITLAVYTFRTAAIATAPLVTRTAIPLPRNQSIAARERAQSLAVSGDGRWIAYVADESNTVQLYLRDLTTTQSRLVPDTTGASYPFFSTDNEWVGFVAAGTLQKVQVGGGAPLTICALPAGAVGASWGPDDTIVFATFGGGLWKVHASGGVAESISGSAPAAWPQILPDGQTVLFTNAPAGSAIALISLAGNDRRILARTTNATEEGPTLLGAGEIAQARYAPVATLCTASPRALCEQYRSTLGG
jgi:hypothetical protein